MITVIDEIFEISKMYIVIIFEIYFINEIPFLFNGKNLGLAFAKENFFYKFVSFILIMLINVDCKTYLSTFLKVNDFLDLMIIFLIISLAKNVRQFINILKRLLFF